ncbi:MAG: hypothetical protein ACK5PB_17945 [Pirellula sp.]|jgi:hypothetical protein
MNRKHDQEDAEFDSIDAELREQFQRMVPVTAERDDVHAIWDALRTELQSDVINVHPSNQAVCVQGKSYLNFRNTLVLAAACCLVSFSSIFMVAAKQQSDGTVLSTTTHLERMIARQQKDRSTNPQLLPEEKELWKQLMAQTATNIDPDSTVVVALTLQQK